MGLAAHCYAIVQVTVGLSKTVAESHSVVQVVLREKGRDLSSRFVLKHRGHGKIEDAEWQTWWAGDTKPRRYCCQLDCRINSVIYLVAG